MSINRCGRLVMLAIPTDRTRAEIRTSRRSNLIVSLLENVGIKHSPVDNFCHL